VDFSETFIEAARKQHPRNNFPQAEFICADVCDFICDHPAEFSKVCALDFVEHIKDTELIRIFSALALGMKPQASLFLHTPNAGFLLERLKTAGILAQLPEHIAVRNVEALVDLLTYCGYRVIRNRWLPHYRWYLSWLHGFSWLPGCRCLFSARLFLECQAIGRADNQGDLNATSRTSAVIRLDSV
jgi:hypothetical protein